MGRLREECRDLAVPRIAVHYFGTLHQLSFHSRAVSREDIAHAAGVPECVAEEVSGSSIYQRPATAGDRRNRRLRERERKSCSHSEPGPRRSRSVIGPKSLVLITVDCLRADHTGFMGYARPTTPFLDSLAAESMVFPNAIVAGAPTYYSFPGLMASRFPLALGRE